jgi:antitoxin component of MazEF toxin-antitoxin module
MSLISFRRVQKIGGSIEISIPANYARVLGLTNDMPVTLFSDGKVISVFPGVKEGGDTRTVYYAAGKQLFMIIPPEMVKAIKIQKGDRVQLQLADGAIFVSRKSGCEHANASKDPESGRWICRSCGMDVTDILQPT